MALLSKLVSVIAEVEGIEESFVISAARYLREAGYITQAGRGRGAAHMQSKDAIALLIAVNASSIAKDAPAVLAEWSQFKWKDERKEIDYSSSGSVEDWSTELSGWAIKPGYTLAMSMDRLLFHCIPLGDGPSSLEKEAGDEGTFLSFSFYRPRKRVEFSYGYYWDHPEEPEGDTFEQGSFMPPDEISADAAGDRSDVVTITKTTLFAVGRALAN